MDGLSPTDADFGGDRRAVQGQCDLCSSAADPSFWGDAVDATLVVACAPFAAILADGSALTWRDALPGVDSIAVLAQFIPVQEIQASDQPLLPQSLMPHCCRLPCISSGTGSDQWSHELMPTPRATAVQSSSSDLDGDSNCAMLRLQSWLMDLRSRAVRNNTSAAQLRFPVPPRKGGGAASDAMSRVVGYLRSQKQRQWSCVCCDEQCGRKWSCDRCDDQCGRTFAISDVFCLGAQLREVQQIPAAGGALAGAVMIDSCRVQHRVQRRDLQQIQAQVAKWMQFVCDGSVVTWGSRDMGGDSNFLLLWLQSLQMDLWWRGVRPTLGKP
ncbi:HERC1 [Symbiodinium sp. CCMP2592]|nr:HERC1 [Symbiodinium sp. CCMP2592]